MSKKHKHSDEEVVEEEVQSQEEQQPETEEQVETLQEPVEDYKRLCRQFKQTLTIIESAV